MKSRIIILLALLATLTTMPLCAQRIIYNEHTSGGARILETTQKKVTSLGEGARKFYMWAGLTSLDIKGIVIYKLKVMYTSEYHLSVEQGDPLVLTLKNGEKVTLHAGAKGESKRLDGVETMFASYEIKEDALMEIARTGITNVAPTVLCFGNKDYSKDISLWRLARPLSLRYELLKDYIEKHPE
ncbi:MAG: hypothetical protein IKQ68_05385 [Prevotella sp.]|nr:hypothetical protein [Prevotella sp.]